MPKKGIRLSKKLTQNDRDRIQMHRRVAPPIPQKRHWKSLEGQTYFDFDGAMTASGESDRHGDTGLTT